MFMRSTSVFLLAFFGIGRALDEGVGKLGFLRVEIDCLKMLSKKKTDFMEEKQRF